jgi:hypothetical protein
MYIAFRALLASALCFSFASHAQQLLGPTNTDDLQYDQRLLTGDYDAAIPDPGDILGFPVGEKTATPAQIVEVITQISGASSRALLVEYARSHEHRPLYYVAISSPENLARIDAVKADLAKLADPRDLSTTQAEQIIQRLPAVAWMAYSIHGNESSGADAALAAIYHLVADQSPATRELLEQSIILIDPSMNPDGRARFVKALQESRSTTPNVDDQSLLHKAYWPWGRGNHYYFDLNRDYIYGTQPESRGKVAAINSWYPQLVIDGHEMGAQAQYHFSPPREPINTHFAPSLARWNNVFAADQAKAFDAQAWPWFNGENFDDLYPGYTTYSQYRGAINILYEQARFAEDGVRQQNGRIETYRSAVHRQLTSTLSNLHTLARNSRAIYRDSLADRRNVLSASGPYAKMSFVILPTENRSRLDAFVDAMNLQGFEMYRADADIPVKNAVHQLGHTQARATIPQGSLVIPNRQPEARLLATLLEFDTEILDETLRKERESLLRGDGSTMYDVTAWNLTMQFGLEAWTVPTNLQKNLVAYKHLPAEEIELTDTALGYIVEGEDDHSVSFAARAMELGLRVRVLTKATILDSAGATRGSVVVYSNDNRSFDGSVSETVTALATELGVSVRSFDSGAGAGDLPDIGGRYFPLLEAPRLAIVSRGTIDTTDVGFIWNSVDRYLGIRHSHLGQAELGGLDLRRYNVIVIPHMHAGGLNEAAINGLSAWVEAGGTLIAVKGAAAALTAANLEFTRVRQITDTFEGQASYDLAVQREWQARNPGLNFEQVRSRTVVEKLRYPWPTREKKPPVKEALARQDSWQKLFMPQGVLLSGRTDQKHWLTFGAGEVLPLLVAKAPILMPDSSAQTAVRFGNFKKIPAARWQQMQLAAKAKAEKTKKPQVRKIGWASLPDEYEVNLRMSGLLWPEAAQRLANAAYLTRDAKGKGQVILFADQPMYRGATLGTNRLLLNAIVYGPALGTDRKIIP